MLLAALVLALAASVHGSGENFGSELGNLDFARIIGGPLNAVVKAQAKAAATTVAFIRAIGFTQESDDEPMTLVEADFIYTTNINGTVEDRVMSVPFLYIVPIPFLQFDSVTVDFAVKLNSVDTSNKTNGVSSTTNWAASAGGWFSPSIDMSGSVTTQYSSTTSTKVSREYSLNIQVHGSQAAMPGGMARMLDLFESIVQQDAAPIDSSKRRKRTAQAAEEAKKAVPASA